MDGREHDVTEILQRVHAGDRKAAEELIPLVYEELRKLAAWHMRKEAAPNTLQATALVHEAYLKLSPEEHKWDGRGHLFSAAAEAMRRILIDRARRRQSLRHGGQAERVDLDLDQMAVATQTEPEELLALNDALEKLAAEDPQSAELIKLRFFVGLTNQEAARALGISERSAKRYWTFARAWLFEEIRCPGATRTDV